VTTTSDESALLRAIAAHPEEDTPRLMYADCIDDDQPEYAEFIRLQIALAWPDSELPACYECRGTKRVMAMHYAPEEAPTHDPYLAETGCRACICPEKYVLTGTARNALTDRVSELWWKSVSKQFALDGVSSVQRIHGEFIRDTKPSLTVSRGFAEILYMPTLAELCEREKCSQCHGLGHWIMQATFDEPPERVPCIRCLGSPGEYTGKPTQLAIEVIRAHPTITRVVVGDRRPIREEGNWRWVCSPGCVNDYAVIGAILSHLPRDVTATEQSALDALAVAAGQWLRSHTGGSQ